MRNSGGFVIAATGVKGETSVSGTTYRREPATTPCTAESRITRVKCNDAFTADACLRTLSPLRAYERTPALYRVSDVFSVDSRTLWTVDNYR